MKMQLVAALPARSNTRVDLTNSFIDELWNSLPHPPLSYLGDKFQYRQADGSYNVHTANPSSKTRLTEVERLVPTVGSRQYSIRSFRFPRHTTAWRSSRSRSYL